MIQYNILDIFVSFIVISPKNNIFFEKNLKKPSLTPREIHALSRTIDLDISDIKHFLCMKSKRFFEPTQISALL